MNPLVPDHKPQFPDGIDPRTAANEFRTLLAAGGKSQGIVAQLAALRFWAEKTGRKIGANCDLSQATIGGLEHYVWPDEAGGLFALRGSRRGNSLGRCLAAIADCLLLILATFHIPRPIPSNHQFRILYVGHIYDLKGPPQLVEALRKSHRPTRMCCGPDAFYAKVEENLAQNRAAGLAESLAHPPRLTAMSAAPPSRSESSCRLVPPAGDYCRWVEDLLPPTENRFSLEASGENETIEE
jgi:hypothetical protein